MGVMKVENIVPRVGIKRAFLAFWASVVPLHHIGSLISPLYTNTHLSMQLLPFEVSADYYTHPPGDVSLLTLTITYMHTGFT